MKNTYSNTAYTQHRGFRHVGIRSVSYFDSEIYCEPDTEVTSSVFVNGVLSFAIREQYNNIPVYNGIVFNNQLTLMYVLRALQ